MFVPSNLSLSPSLPRPCLRTLSAAPLRRLFISELCLEAHYEGSGEWGGGGRGTPRAASHALVELKSMWWIGVFGDQISSSLDTHTLTLTV
jgi:hypothetical protein